MDRLDSFPSLLPLSRTDSVFLQFYYSITFKEPLVFFYVECMTKNAFFPSNYPSSADALYIYIYIYCSASMQRGMTVLHTSNKIPNENTPLTAIINPVG